MKNEKVWVSPTITIPPTTLNSKFCICRFSLLKSMLSRNITFHVMARDDSVPTSHPLPNMVVGSTDITDLNLKTLLYATMDENGKIPLNWSKETKLYRAFEDVRGMIDLSVKLQNQLDGAQEEKEFQAHREKENDLTLKEGIDLYADLVERNIEVMAIIKEEGPKWRIIQEQLTRSQEDVRRILNEIDLTAQSVKLSAAEVINLKRKIRNIKKENLELRQEIERAKQFEPEVFQNRPELMQMDDEEVRNKVIAIAKAYRDERVRNKTLMKTLKLAQKDIAGRTKVLATLQRVEESTGEITNKMAALAHEFGKLEMYRETIGKQEAMVVRLEGILKTIAKESKDMRVESEKYRKEKEENQKLRVNINNYVVPDSSKEYNEFRAQIQTLEREITKLQDDLLSKRPVSAHKVKQMGDMADKEVELDMFHAREEALERQISVNNTTYAQQITILKTKIADKEAMIKAIQKDY